MHFFPNFSPFPLPLARPRAAGERGSPDLRDSRETGRRITRDPRWSPRHEPHLPCNSSAPRRSTHGKRAEAVPSSPRTPSRLLHRGVSWRRGGSRRAELHRILVDAGVEEAVAPAHRALRLTCFIGDMCKGPVFFIFLFLHIYVFFHFLFQFEMCVLLVNLWWGS